MNKNFVGKYALLLIFTLLFITLSGQQASVLRNYLTVEECVSHNEVTAIVQNNDGFVWIGTRGGLNWYIGNKFKIFNPFRTI